MVLLYTLEAEDGLVSGGVRTASSRSGFSGTGYVTNFKAYADNTASKWYALVTVPESGHYTLTVRCAADAARTLTLRINGQDIGESRVRPGQGFYDIPYTAVWLEQGLNRLSVTQSAGGVDLDRIVIDVGRRCRPLCIRTSPPPPAIRTPTARRGGSCSTLRIFTARRRWPGSIPAAIL